MTQPAKARAGQNLLVGYREFMAQWRDRRGAGHAGEALAKSALGNINATASPECDHAQVFGPSDQRFGASLEPGIRALVVAMVTELDWVTYTSCEGHPRTSDVPMRRRNVGILPQTADELEAIARTLERAIAAVTVRHGRAPAYLKMTRSVLDTDQGPKPCLDLAVYPQGATWSTYRETADDLQFALIDELLATRTGSASSAEGGACR